MELLNTEETYRNLQPFHTLEQLNANTTAIRGLHADKMTRSTYRVLDILHRYSCKYPGVSYRSKSKIAAELGITRRTVINACNSLESLGIIQQHELKRHNGDKRQSSNAITFVPIEPVEKENFTPEFHTKETPLNTNKPKPSFHDTFQFEPSLFNRFKSILSNTTGETKQASNLFGVYRSQSIKLQRFEIHADKQKLFESLALQALTITTQATKRKKIKSITGYYSGVLQELIGKTLFDDAFKNYDADPIELCTH